MPTRDVRAHLAWLLHSQFGLEKSTLENTIFPDLDMGEVPSVIR